MIETDTRLDGASLDITAEKRRELLELFPEAHGEGETIDFERLRRSLGDAVETGKERYGLTWPGKADCYKTIQTPSMATLLPAPEKSVNFDSTENLIIEGDNLEVLKLLQKSYLGKIKMIYIDPPYNTGNDFIYPDDYSESLRTYLQYTGQVDADGRKFGTNSDMSGRFHSKWLNMMYPRLYLARNLLRDDGICYVSISDVELHNLIALCNEIFGESNHLATFVWVNEGNIDNQSRFKTNHEYVVGFARDESQVKAPPVIDPNISKGSKLYRDNIENSIVKNGPANPVSDVTLPIGFPANFDNKVIHPKPDFWPQMSGDVKVTNGKTVSAVRVRSGWSSKDLLTEFIANGCNPLFDAKGQETDFYLTSSGTIMMRKRRSEKQSHVLTVLRGMGTVRSAAVALEALGIAFSYPKPVRLMEYLIETATARGDVVLDLFAGSGTTAEGALATDRRFFLVQLPEATGRSDYPTISDIAEERVRRVAGQMDESRDRKLAFDASAKQDRGFRVFKLAESNIKEWDAGVCQDVEALKRQLTLNVDHLRQDRRDIDILFEIILKEGFPLSAAVDEQTIEGKRVYSIAEGAFLICLERDLSLELLRAIAAREPQRVTLLDEGFAANDQLKTNAVQTFKDKDIVFRTL